MNTSDIISSILAGLTFLGIIVALGLGIWSMLETKNLQKIQHTERIIDNILDWLLDIPKCEAKYNISSLLESQQITKDTESAKSYYSIIAGNRGNEFRILKNKGIILASHFRDKEQLLPKTIGKLNEELQILADINDKYRVSFLELAASPTDFPKVTALLNSYRDEAQKVNKKKRNFTETIMNEAIKLKYVKSFL